LQFQLGAPQFSTSRQRLCQHLTFSLLPPFRARSGSASPLSRWPAKALPLRAGRSVFQMHQGAAWTLTRFPPNIAVGAAGPPPMSRPSTGPVRAALAPKDPADAMVAIGWALEADDARENSDPDCCRSRQCPGAPAGGDHRYGVSRPASEAVGGLEPVATARARVAQMAVSAARSGPEHAA
jgi:hypothetical protein